MVGVEGRSESKSGEGGCVEGMKGIEDRLDVLARRGTLVNMFLKFTKEHGGRRITKRSELWGRRVELGRD